MEATQLEAFTPYPLVREWKVKTAHVHPEGDIALLEMTEGGARVEPFAGFLTDYMVGDDFAAFGFPESIFGPDQREPTPRFFKGHFQRLMIYASNFGYGYLAAELNIPAPAGLSGGPVFPPNSPEFVTGIVTESLESTTYLEETQREEVGTEVRQIHYQRVVQYGVALMLDQVAVWIDEHMPDPEND